MEKLFKTKFFTGFKALGVLMIIYAHLHYELPALPDFWYKTLAFAGYFVILFFCISAYTIAMSLDRNPQLSIFQFMKRRWIRLAPAYYALIPIGLLFKIASNHWVVPTDTIKDLFLHITFLNLNLIYEPSQSSYLGFEWMMPMLFWFYLLMPLLLYLIRKRFVLFSIVFACSIYLHTHLSFIVTYRGVMQGFRSMQVWLILYTYTATIYELYKVGINAFFHGKNFTQTILRVVGLVIPIGILLSQLSTKSELLYAIGLLIMTIYLLWLKPLVMNLVSKKSIILVRFVNNIDVFVLCVIVIKYMINIYYIKNPHIIMLLWFANMIIAGNRGSDIIKLFFENRIMQFIGTISYALYLDHNLAITITGYIIPAQYWGLRIALILFLAFSGAYILHTYIEQPVQKRLMKMLT